MNMEKTENREAEKKTGRFAAVILAAGRGKRMNSKVQKQFLMLEGKPLLWYSLVAFEVSRVEDVILVAGRDEVEYCRAQIDEVYGLHKIRAVVPGGEERYHSVYEGLKALTLIGYNAGDFVLIHDGARPFVDQGIIDRVSEDAVRYGACVAGMPSKDTVKLADEDNFARLTPDRASVWSIQTPQAFSFSLIYEAYGRMMSRKEYQRGITDDAMVVETMTDARVKLTEGSYQNIKVTTPEDMDVAKAFLRKKI